MFVDLLNGTYPVLMDLTWGFVDVRDVAKAHIHALEIPSAAGRYLCAADTVSMRDVVAILKPVAGPKAKLPSLSLDNGFGTTLMKLASYAQPAGVGSYLRSHLGRTPRYDTSKIRKELGLSFRDVRNTIVDTIADLRKAGHLPGA